VRRVRTKIGDVFSVPLDNSGKKYFQYVANDLTQLNSDIIRAFKRLYPSDCASDLREVVSGEVDFYAHVVIKWGIKRNLWEKVGSVPYDEMPEVWFRDTNDYGIKLGAIPVEISHNWYVWRINEEFRHVGKLEGEFQKAQIGIVVRPDDIVNRLRTGQYKFSYPGY